MKLIQRATNLPVIGALAKKIQKILADRHAKSIASHFSYYLRPCFAETEALKNESFKIRHGVYCDELKFEEPRESGLETDEFDEHAYHCLIQHKSRGTYAGTVRVIYSSSEDQILPIEKYCQSAIGNEHLQPSRFERHRIAEISRLAVPAEFRRRSVDKHQGAATGAINMDIYSEQELRCFPFIAVGLYLSATSLVLQKGIDHCFVMMEPRLARSLRFVGIPFEQIGPVVDYHGKRAPYHVNPNRIPETLSPGFKKLLSSINSEMLKQL